MPSIKTRNALEEAEWEDEDGNDGGLTRELRLQGRRNKRNCAALSDILHSHGKS